MNKKILALLFLLAGCGFMQSSDEDLAMRQRRINEWVTLMNLKDAPLSCNNDREYQRAICSSVMGERPVTFVCGKLGCRWVQ